MKILIRDVNQSHGNLVKGKVLEFCPTADVEIMFCDFTFAIGAAYAMSFDIIVSAASPFVHDAFFDTYGDDAWCGTGAKLNRSGFSAGFDDGFGIDHAFPVGIVLAHGSNSHVELESTTRLDIISVVGNSVDSVCNGSYGDGLEYMADEATESEAAGAIAGMIGQLMIDHPDWNFQDARQALRQTASNYDTGWNKENGFGTVNPDAANAIETSQLKPLPPYRILVENGNGSVKFSFEQSPSNRQTEVVVVKFKERPEPHITTPDAGDIVYRGNATSHEYNHTSCGKRWFGVFASGSYSDLESFLIFEVDLSYETQTPIYTDIATAIKKKFDETCLGEHSRIYNYLSGRLYYTNAPADTEYPYCVFYILDHLHELSFCSEIDLFRIQFNIFDNANGLVHSAVDINKYIAGLFEVFDYASLSLSDHLCSEACVYRDISITPIIINGVWQGSVRYTLKVQKDRSDNE